MSDRLDCGVPRWFCVRLGILPETAMAFTFRRTCLYCVYVISVASAKVWSALWLLSGSKFYAIFLARYNHDSYYMLRMYNILTHSLTAALDQRGSYSDLHNERSCATPSRLCTRDPLPPVVSRSSLADQVDASSRGQGIWPATGWHSAGGYCGLARLVVGGKHIQWLLKRCVMSLLFSIRVRRVRPTRGGCNTRSSSRST